MRRLTIKDIKVQIDVRPAHIEGTLMVHISSPNSLTFVGKSMVKCSLSNGNSCGMTPYEGEKHIVELSDEEWERVQDVMKTYAAAVCHRNNMTIWTR